MSRYLCYDVKGIQSFIFKIPKLKYIIGGSALVDIFDTAATLRRECTLHLKKYRPTTCRKPPLKYKEWDVKLSGAPIGSKDRIKFKKEGLLKETANKLSFLNIFG